MHPHDANSDLKKKLFEDANSGDWEKVVKTYEQNPATHSAEITRSGDTALHVAVSNGEESAVKKLVAVVWEKTRRSALEKKNELGNTPLHLAAYIGNAEMCRCLAKLDSTLMGIRNEDNETPFFVAVRHGRKEAFRELHFLCGSREGYHYCRGKEGETILHSAISGEYFDLAFYIINEYGELLNAYNEQGFSPLHILANKPSAFKSGSHLRGFDKLIYHCIFIDEHELVNTPYSQPVDLAYKEDSMYPENYHACVGMFILLWNLIWVLLGHSSDNNDEESNTHVEHHGEETAKEHQQNKKHSKIMDLCRRRDSNAERDQSKKIKEEVEGSNKRKAQGHEFLPTNYFTFFNFIKLLSKVMLVIFGLGSKSVEKMREKKAKHIWSGLIMEKLLEKASSYDYQYNGRSPGITNPTTKDAAVNSGSLPNAAADLNPTTINELPSENQIFDAPPPDLPPENPNSNKPKSEVTNLPPSECREVLCALLREICPERINSRLREICPERGGVMEMEKRETPVLIAAKNGVLEMVQGILEKLTVAIHDMNSEQKNVVLLAVEHRQPHVYNFLLEHCKMKDTVFRKTDKDGNSALHLAAMLGKYRPWLIPGAALQMQWEIKWYEFVKSSMTPHFFPRHNHLSETHRDIFSRTHDELAKEGGAWLTNTSESCSVVAALIATVAFATSATVPGGVKSDNSGTPTLQNQPAFSIFAISSLVALCFSVTSVVMFLAILTSRFEEMDFRINLPRKLMIGLTSLFISIGSMLLSFCAGHFFVLKEKLQYAAFPMYAITCLPVTFFAIAQFPLYFDLIRATISKVPQRSSRK